MHLTNKKNRLRFVFNGVLEGLPAEDCVFTSCERDWSGSSFEYRRRPVRPAIERVHGIKPALTYVLAGEATLTSFHRGMKRRIFAKPGMVNFSIPFEECRDLYFDSAVELLVLELAHELISPHTAEALNKLRVEPIQADTQLSRLLRCALDEATRGSPSGPMFAESISLAILAYASERYSRGSAVEKRQPLKEVVTLVDRYVSENLDQEITLEQLANVVGVTPEHLCRSFKKCAGITPYQYVLEKRVSRAKELIIDGRYSLAEIAYKLGFASQSHFTSIFRGRVGVSPRKFYLASQ